jgi:hypothetical protein
VPWGGPPRLGDHHQLRRLVAERPPLEVAVQRHQPEAGARQQVLQLVAEVVAQRNAGGEPLGAPVGVRDVGGDLHVVHLPRRLEAQHARRPPHAPPVGEQPLRLVLHLPRELLAVAEAPRVGVEDVEHQPPARQQVAAHELQAGELLLRVQQVLEDAEGRGDE